MVDINFRKRKILEIIKALEENPKFSTMSLEMIKNAVLTNERIIYNKCTTKSQYINAINDKLTKIKESSTRKLIEDKSVEEDQVDVYEEEPPYIARMQGRTREEYETSSPLNQMHCEGYIDERRRKSLEGLRGFSHGRKSNDEYFCSSGKNLPSMGRNRQVRNVSGGFHKSPNKCLVSSEEYNGYDDYIDSGTSTGMINIPEKIEKIIAEKSNFYASVNINNQLVNYKDKIRSSRQNLSDVCDDLTGEIKNSQIPSFTTMSTTKADLLELARKIKAKSSSSCFKKPQLENSKAMENKSQHLQKDAAGIFKQCKIDTQALQRFLHQENLKLIKVNNHKTWLINLSFCYSNIRLIKNSFFRKKVVYQYKYHNFPFMTEQSLREILDTIKCLYKKEEEANEEILFNL